METNRRAAGRCGSSLSHMPDMVGEPAVDQWTKHREQEGDGEINGAFAGSEVPCHTNTKGVGLEDEKTHWTWWEMFNDRSFNTTYPSNLRQPQVRRVCFFCKKKKKESG